MIFFAQLSVFCDKSCGWLASLSSRAAFSQCLGQNEAPRPPDGFPTQGSTFCGPLEKNKNTAARHAVRQAFGVNSIMAELCVKGCNVRDKASAAAAAEQINSCVGGKEEEGGGRWRARRAVQFRGREKSQPGYNQQTSLQSELS